MIKLEKEGQVDMDRCAGPWVSLRINDLKEEDIPQKANKDKKDRMFMRATFGGMGVLLTSEEARSVAKSLLKYSREVDEQPHV